MKEHAIKRSVNILKYNNLIKHTSPLTPIPTKQNEKKRSVPRQCNLRFELSLINQMHE